MGLWFQVGAKVWRWGWAGRRWGHTERLVGDKVRGRRGGWPASKWTSGTTSKAEAQSCLKSPELETQGQNGYLACTQPRSGIKENGWSPSTLLA